MEQQQIDTELKFVWKLFRWLGINLVIEYPEANKSKSKTLMLILLPIMSIIPKIASMYIFRARIDPDVHYSGIVNRLLMILVWWYLYFNKKGIRRMSTKLDKIASPSLKINLLKEIALTCVICSHIMLTGRSYFNRERLVFFKFDYMKAQGIGENTLIIMNICLHFFVPLVFPVMISYISCTICCRLRDALEMFNFELRSRIENQLQFQSNVLDRYENIIGALAIFDKAFSVPSLLVGFVLLSNVFYGLEGFATWWIKGHITGYAAFEPTLTLIPSACCILAMLLYASEMTRTMKDIKKHLQRLHVRMQGADSADRTVVEAMNRRKVHSGGKMIPYRTLILVISAAVIAFAKQYSTEKRYFPLSL